MNAEIARKAWKKPPRQSISVREAFAGISFLLMCVPGISTRSARRRKNLIC
jgi:hypothetical protein